MQQLESLYTEQVKTPGLRMLLQQQLNHHLEAQPINLTERGLYDQVTTQVSMMESK